MPNIFEKTSLARLDYKFDWRAKTNGSSSDPGVKDWLKPNEIIAIASVIPSAVNGGSLISISGSYLSDSNSSVVVWLTGGDKYKEYDIVCNIETDSTPFTRVDQKTIKVRII